VFFKVDDIDQAYGTLHERGVHFVDEPHLIVRMPDHELWMSAFTDPDDKGWS
jgi:methylmalonyl-CoA/ethylmalonyl-CoA epimerase